MLFLPLRLRYFFALVFFLGFWPSAGCMVQNTREKLTEAIREYNNAIRWRNMDWAIQHVPKEQRDSFISEQRKLQNLQVTLCEIGTIKIVDSDHARAMIKIEWYLTNRGVVRTTYVEQTWKQKNGDWQVVEQRLLKGPPLPFIKT